MFYYVGTSMVKIPSSHFSDYEINQDGSITQDILSYPKYFRDSDGALAAIDTVIVSSQDTGWDWEVKKGVYKLRIKNDGTFEFNHLNDIVSLKLNGLGFFNGDTKQRVTPNQTQVTLTNPTVNGNSITWSLPGGSTYKIEYINDTLKDILTVGSAVKSFLKNNKPNGWTANDTWVGLIYDINLADSSMIESDDIETDEDVKFVSNGRTKHRIRQAWAKSTNYEDLVIDENGNPTNSSKNALAWKRRRIVKSGKYIEVIKANALDVADDGSLVFNTDITFQEGTDSYTGCVDSYIYASATTTNYGSSDVLNCDWRFGSGNYRTLIRFDISSIPNGSTISAATLSLYRDGTFLNATVSVYALYKEFVEGTVTYNIWDTGSNWGTSGCGNTDDSGSNNSGAGTGADRRATAADSQGAGTASGFLDFNVQADISNWFTNGDWGNRGWYVHVPNGQGSGNPSKFKSRNHATTADRPKLAITYTAGGGATTGGMTPRSSWWGDL